MQPGAAEFAQAVYTVAETGRDDDGINYVMGANVGGFVKVADALLAYGTV